MIRQYQGHLSAMIALALAAVFLFTAILKWWNPNAFIAAMLAVDVLPRWMVSMTGEMAPLAEAMIATALVIPAYRVVGAWSGLVLVAMFFVYIGCAWWLERPMRCGCFASVLVIDSWRNQAIIDGFIALGLATVILLRRSSKITAAVIREDPPDEDALSHRG